MEKDEKQSLESLEQYKFGYYPTVFAKNEDKRTIVTLKDMVDLIKTPPLEYINVIKTVRYQCDQYIETGEKIWKDRYMDEKKKLPSFTPSGIFKKVDSNGLESYSMLFCGDFDYKDNKKFFDEGGITQLCYDYHVLVAFLSPNGRGYKVIVSYTWNSTGEIDWESIYQAIADYFKQRLGLVIDFNGSSICMGCYLSWDPDIYVAKKAFPFLIDKVRPQPKVYNPEAIDSEPQPKTEVKIKRRKIQDEFVEHEEDIIKILTWVEREKVDITPDYKSWVTLAWVLTNSLRESDKIVEYFHRFSKFYKKYNSKEAELKINDIISSWDNTTKIKVTIKTLYHMAKEHGYFASREDFKEHKFTATDIPFLIRTEFLSDTETDFLTSFDKVTRREFINIKGKQTYIDDRLITTIKITLNEKYGTNFSSNIVMDYLHNDRYCEYYGPFELWLSQADPTKEDIYEKELRRFTDFLVCTTDNDYGDHKYLVLKRWMLSVMINYFYPNKYSDDILIWRSIQDFGKTTLMKEHLCKWFMDNKCMVAGNFKWDSENRDIINLMATNIIMFDDELKAHLKAVAESIKNITSITEVPVRLAYDHKVSYLTRICTFAGATNNNGVYSDDTGGRRYLILDLEDSYYGPRILKDPAFVHKALKELNINWNWLWYYAYLLYKKGVMHYDIPVNKQVAKNYADEKQEYEFIRTFIEPSDTFTMTLVDILTFLEKDCGMKNRNYTPQQWKQLLSNCGIHPLVKDGKAQRKSGGISYMCKKARIPDDTFPESRIPIDQLPDPDECKDIPFSKLL